MVYVRETFIFQNLWSLILLLGIFIYLKYLVTHTSTDIQVTNADHENLISQISGAKSVHITGGDTPHLVKEMLGYPDFVNALKGKVVGGSSAGAYLFSTYYFLITNQTY